MTHGHFTDVQAVVNGAAPSRPSGTRRRLIAALGLLSLLWFNLGSAKANAKNPVSGFGSASTNEARGASNLTHDTAENISTLQYSQIKTFLNARLEARAVGKDLRSIILKRIDLLAAGSKADADVTEISDFPSVAQQISWQYALRDIAADFRKTYPSRVNAHSISHAPDVNSPPTSAEFLLWSIPNIVENAQGAFSSTFMEQPFPSYLAASPPSRGNRKVGIGSIRPAATGSEDIDRRIAESLFDAGIGSAAQLEESSSEFTVLEKADVFNTLESIRICAHSEKCSSFPSADNARTSKMNLRKVRNNLFERLYLSNPYGGRSSATAVVEVDNASRAVKVFVGPKDLGYLSLQAATPFDDLRLADIARQLKKFRI